MFQQIMMGFQTVRVKSHFLYLDQNEQLQCCSAEDSYYDAIIKSHLILFEDCDSHKNVQSWKLSDLDPQVSQKVKAIEQYQELQFSEHCRWGQYFSLDMYS